MSIEEIARLIAAERHNRLDEMTGLMRRDSFLDTLSDKRAKIHSAEDSDNMMFVFMTDIVKMRRINKKFGHEGGDRAIAAIGKAIKDMCDLDENLHCLAGRLGGDEFALAVAFDSSVIKFSDAILKIYDGMDNLSKQTGYRLRIGDPALSTPDKMETDLLKEADPKAPRSRRQKFGRAALNAAWSVRRQLPSRNPA